jgi:hypothetical protein
MGGKGMGGKRGKREKNNSSHRRGQRIEDGV